MNKLDLQQILDKAYNSFFLDSIEVIAEADSSYKKSDYYKTTEVPLIKLYESYFMYRESKYSFGERLNDFVADLDTEKLVDLFVEWLDKAQENEKFIQTLTQITDKFDLGFIKDNKEAVQKLVDSIKN